MFQAVHLQRHQQRSFTLKMHQNRWPRTHWGSLQRSPRSPSLIKGATSKGREREDRGRGGTLDPHNVGDRLTPLTYHQNCCKYLVERVCHLRQILRLYVFESRYAETSHHT